MATFGTTIGSGGIRLYDAGHEVSYNYVAGVYGGPFQNALTLDSGDAEGSSTALDAHWRVVNALVERNVLVGNPTGIVIGNNYSLAPTGCTIRDNLVAQAGSGTAVTQLVAPVSSGLSNNVYFATPAGGGFTQGSDTIWRKAGYGPRLTFLQAGDVGPNADLDDADGTGVLIPGAGGGGTVDDGTAAAKFGWGTPLGQSDEFGYTGAPASTKWGVYNGPGHDGNGQRLPARVTVANDKMVLTGLANGDSAGLEHRFDQRYGRWEVRCRSFANAASNGNDYHPVLIIWPTSDNWPEDGEYDFLENGTPGAQIAEAYIHYPHPASVSVQQEHFAKSGVDLSAFHNFAIEWTPNGITTWIDGVQWFTIAGGGGPSGRSDIQDMPSGHLTVQLDNFDGTNQTPATFEVEWVRVYSLTPSGGTAGPQTVNAVGIPSAAAFGVPFISGGGATAPPPNTTPTLLGVNTVLGGSTLGYTAVGGTDPGTPGVQTVRPVGIPSAQAFGSPLVTVADGPPAVVAVGIPSAAAFGRPTVTGGGVPAPAPGGVLVPALYAVAADGHTLTPLPAWASIKLSPVRNNAGSLEVTYPAGAPGFQYLHDHVSATPLRALEVRVWIGGSQEGALGGWLVQKSGDDLTPGSMWTFSGHFHEWLLTKAIVFPQAISEANKNGELRFAGATAGLILGTLMDQAQARGALPLVSRDFTSTADSNGVAWANAISSLKLSPATTTVAQVADKLVELGMCEYELTAGRVWRAYNPGGRGTDRTTGTTPLTFAHAVNLAEHSRRESVRDAGTAVLVVGAEGFYQSASSATAQAQLGWRAEVGVSAGQLDSQAAVQAVAPRYLETSSAGTAEYAAAVEFGPGASIPLIDYGVGDWAYTTAGAGGTGPVRRRLRIAQIELEFGKDRPATGKAVFNDLITDRLTALYRRLNAISTGDAVVGTSESTPGGAGEDTIPPAAPTGLTVASVDAYQQPGESETYALVVAGWAPVTTNAYADQVTADKASAAGLIVQRALAGLGFHTDWSYDGAPSVVVTYAPVLLEEYKADPVSVDDTALFSEVAFTWLDDYAAAHQGGGAVTDDVAHYRVQWRFTGSQVVPSRQDPGNGTGEPIPPRDPNAFPEDAAWVEPGESPTTTTRIEFGSVLAGRAINVRVSAVDRTGNQGPWCIPVGVVTAIDNQPPPAPSKPTVKAGFRLIQVTWDGKGSSGEDMVAAAPDILSGGGVELHVAQGIDFTPDRPSGPGVGKVDLSTSTTYVTTLYDAMTYPVNGLTNGVTYYARFVAVDRSGNASAPSETSDGATPNQLVTIDYGPDTVDRATIRAAAIGSAEIDRLAVNESHIGSVNASSITTGTMTADVTVGGRFSTPLSSTGNKVEFDSAGFRMYRGSTVVGRWQTADGSILITGQFNSAVTGQRVVINPGGGNPDTIRLYPTFSDVYSSIDSVDFQGGTIAGIRIVGSGTTAASNRGMIIVRDQYASIVHGRTDLSYWGSEIWVEQNFTRNKSATVDLIVDERLTPVGGERRVAMIHYNASGQPINATGLYYKKTDFNGGEPFLYGNGQDVGLVFGGGRMVVSNNPNAARRGIIAAEFIVESSRAVKYGFRDVDGDPIRHLRKAKPRHFKLKAAPDGDVQSEKLGFVAEEMPPEVRETVIFPGTDGRSDRVLEGLDYNAITALQWAMLQKIDERLSALEGRKETDA